MSQGRGGGWRLLGGARTDLARARRDADPDAETAALDAIAELEVRLEAPVFDFRGKGQAQS